MGSDFELDPKPNGDFVFLNNQTQNRIPNSILLQTGIGTGITLL
jgi:hypothetical protein